MAPKVNKFAVQQDFPVSVEVFRKLFWEEDGTFERSFHETIRMDSGICHNNEVFRNFADVEITDWENNVRRKSYKPNVKILGGMKVSGITLRISLN